MPDRFPLLLPLMLCAAFPLRAITTPEIAASALSPDCVNYRVVGLCYWLYCTPFGCTVRTSVKVSHFRPDLVVAPMSVKCGRSRRIDLAEAPFPIIISIAKSSIAG